MLPNIPTYVHIVDILVAIMKSTWKIILAPGMRDALGFQIPGEKGPQIYPVPFPGKSALPFSIPKSIQTLFKHPDLPSPSIWHGVTSPECSLLVRLLIIRATLFSNRRKPPIPSSVNSENDYSLFGSKYERDFKSSREEHHPKASEALRRREKEVVGNRIITGLTRLRYTGLGQKEGCCLSLDCYLVISIRTTANLLLYGM